MGMNIVILPVKDKRGAVKLEPSCSLQTLQLLPVIPERKTESKLSKVGQVTYHLCNQPTSWEAF